MSECFECGEQAAYMHHVVPRILGGTKTVPLCAKCHAKVHDRKCLSMNHLTKVALRLKMSKGEKVSAIPPYGARFTADGRLRPYPAELATMKAARALRARGWSLRRIGARLAARGMKPRSGGAWWCHSVQCLLRDPPTFAKDQTELGFDEVGA
jgi:hypothetical protein